MSWGTSNPSIRTVKKKSDYMNPLFRDVNHTLLLSDSPTHSGCHPHFLSLIQKSHSETRIHAYF